MSQVQIKSGQLPGYATFIASVTVCAALCILGLGAPADAKQKFALFDAPGSIFTEPEDINADGVIVGEYAHVNGVGHAFMRAADGTIATIDVPGSNQNEARAINAKGVIVGYTVLGG